MPAPTRSRRFWKRSISPRARQGLALLAHRIEVLRLSHEIGQQTKAPLDERQREVLLREQMAAIQRQLGEGDGPTAGVAELDEAITKANMPPEVEEQAPQGAAAAASACRRRHAKHGMIRTYLDWLIELPWALPEAKPIDIARGAPHPRRGPFRA